MPDFLVSGTPGATLTPANTGATSVYVIAAGFNSAVFVSGGPGGVVGAKFTRVADGNVGGAFAQFTLASSNLWASSLSFIMPTLPTTEQYSFMVTRTDSTRVTNFLINNAGLHFLDKSNLYTRVLTAAQVTAQAGKWTRVTMNIDNNGGTATGTIKASAYDRTTGTLLGTATQTNATLVAAPFAAAVVGVTTDYVTSITVAEFILRPGSTTEVPAFVQALLNVSPISVTANAGPWTGSVSDVNDTSDSTYFESPQAPTNATLTLRLGALVVGSTFDLDIRSALTVSGLNTTQVKLLDNGNLRKTWTITPTTTLTTTTLSLTAAEVATIVNWDALDVVISFVASA
jgi:hypothetical protein